MADPIRLISRNGHPSDAGAVGFARVEMQVAGGALTFEVDPATARSRAIGGGRRRLEARLCCAFGSDVRLAITWDRNEVLAATVGELDLERAWNQNPNGAHPVLRRHDPGRPGSVLDRAVLRNVRLRSGRRRPTLVMYLRPLPGRSGLIAPILTVEGTAERPHGRRASDPTTSYFAAFGELVPWPAEASTLRISQLPGVPSAGSDEPAARRWLIGIEGVPFAIGRRIWNAVTEASVETTILDRQEATVFVPRIGEGTATTAGMPDARHPWRLLVELDDPDLTESRVSRSSARSVGLTPSPVGADAAEADLEFPRLVDHSGRPMRARLRLEPTSRGGGGFDADLDAHRRLEREPGLVLRGAPGRPLSPHALSSGSAVRFDTLDLRFLTSARPLPMPHERCFARWEVAPRGRGAHPGRYELVHAETQFLWLLDDLAAGAANRSEWSALDFDDEAGPHGPPVVITRPRTSRATPALLRVSDRQPRDARGNPGQRVIELHVERLLDQAPSRRADAPALPEPEHGMGVCPPAPDHEQVVILSQEPMLVAQVSFPAGLVVHWSSRAPNAGSWRMLPGAAGDACLTMPPQAVGEGVEKLRSLGEGELADFRFSPPALLALREQLADRQSFAVPWDLLHLMTRSDLGLPGAQVDHMQYELLYGLSCRLDSELLRLAEIGTLIGKPPGGMHPTPAWLPAGDLESQAREAWHHARERWARTRRRLRGRLGIFELWQRDTLEAMEIQSGVTCWIRGHRPLADGETEPRRPPELAEVPEAELADPFADPAAAHPDDGLRGGVTYGFESRNVYRAVMRPSADDRWPRSDDAGTSHLRLSSLGGYGSLAAQFDSRRSRILADVSLGRTYAYTLERIGRIGVWWNRAKHVIVYERTVLPSRQFMNDQNPHAGRAVVRKVLEYVEILQNVRTYPEDAGGDARAVGPVRSCAFAAKEEEKVVRFLVRSDWGSDVGDHGWKVPLWHPNAQPADLYPKPVVKLEMLSGPDGGGAPEEVTIADPENLHFWTDTTPPSQAAAGVDMGDPDQWVAIEGVDYVRAPPPETAKEPAFAQGRLEQTAMADGVIAPAFRPCTFLLESSVHTVDLLAHRDAEPMGAALSSITLMREPPARRVAPPAVAQTPPTPADAQAVQPPADAPATPSPADAETPPPPPPLEQALKQLQDKLADEVLGWMSKIARGDGLFDPAQLQVALTDACNRLAIEADALDTRYRQTATDATTHLTNLISQIESQILTSIDHLFDQALFRAKPDSGEQGLLERGLELALRSLRDVRGTSADPPIDRWKELLRQDVVDEVDRARALIVARLPSPSAASDLVRPALREVEAQLVTLEARVGQMRRDIAEFRDQRLDPSGFQRQVTGYLAVFSTFLDRLDGAVGAARRVQVQVGQETRKVPTAHVVRQWVKTVEVALARGTNELAGMVQRGREAEAMLREYQGRLGAQAVALRDHIVGGVEACLPGQDRFAAAAAVLAEARRELAIIDGKVETQRDTHLNAIEKALLDKVDGLLGKLPRSPRPSELQQLQQWMGDWEAAIEAQKNELRAAVATHRTRLREELAKVAEEARDEIKPGVASWAGKTLEIPSLQAGAGQMVRKRCAELSDDLRTLLAAVGEQAEAARAFVEAAGRRIAEQVGREIGDALRLDEGMAETAAETGDKVLRLVRAFGKPPEVAGLQFDRPEVAFLYDELDNRVGITPVIARAAQVSAVSEALKPLGIDLPVKQLAAKLVPAALESFDLSSIFPNIAGIPLQNLFGGVKLPSAANDAIKVTHGLDTKTRRGWVNVAADVPLPGQVRMFAFGPLSVVMLAPRLVATARMEVGLDGRTSRRVEGRLSGDWQLVIGGCELINFRQTALDFDGDGNIRFDIDPSRVELAPALSFVNDLLAQIAPGGLSIRFTGAAVVSSLDLPIPDTQVGAFGYSGLTLSASLSLFFTPDFKLALTAGLARRDAPFTLTIFILGGGGYVQVGAEYTPKTGRIEAVADLAIAVSASLAIALGPIRGGVAVYVGVTAQYRSSTGGGLVAGVMFMIRGHVSVLSIASATITLRLDAQYDRGSLIGTGTFEIKIKICWCFTLEVSERVQYTLAGSGSAQASFGPRPVTRLASLDPAAYLGGSRETSDGIALEVFERRISDYVDMLV